MKSVFATNSAPSFFAMLDDWERDTLPEFPAPASGETPLTACAAADAALLPGQPGGNVAPLSGGAASDLRETLIDITMVQRFSYAGYAREREARESGGFGGVFAPPAGELAT